MNVNVKWKGDLRFKGTGKSGESIIMDVSNDVDEQNKGVSPMETLLISLGGCTGIDVITILNKMRIDIEKLNIEINADRAETLPSRFTHININYQLKGSCLENTKIEKAVKLTQEKYCSVLGSLNADISYNYEINGVKY